MIAGADEAHGFSASFANIGNSFATFGPSARQDQQSSMK